MTGRRGKVEELMEGFMSLKHRAMLSTRSAKDGPRITPSQWGVVMFMRNHKSCTVKEIAQAFGITSSAATQLVDGLAKSGYVLRTVGKLDRRSVALVLSPKTRAHLEAMKKAAIAEFLGLFKILTDREFDEYCSLSRKIVSGFSRGQ